MPWWGWLAIGLVAGSVITYALIAQEIGARVAEYRQMASQSNGQTDSQ